jgi:hypothetical protein
MHMGNFYVSHTLRGTSQRDVAEALTGRLAVITPPRNDSIVVFDRDSDMQDPKVISDLGGRLSRALNCPVLAVLNHDDDVLWYWLFEQGELVDEYNSAPGYFNQSSGTFGRGGGEAGKLCAAFGGGHVGEVESILRKHCTATERHSELVRALGIPPFGIGGYSHICSGWVPNGLEERDLIELK